MRVPAAELSSRDLSGYTSIVRLRRGVSIARAQDEMTRHAARLDALRPAADRGWTAILQSFDDAAVGDVRRGLWLLFASVSLILLLACGNAAQLLLARNASRATELGIRAAIGASRVRLVRTTLLEALLLAAPSALAGLGLATAMARALVALNPGIPRMEAMSIDARVFGFSLAAAGSTVLLFGLGPALLASTADVSALLRRATDRFTTRDRRLSSALIAGEVALAVVLLAGAALFVRSYANVHRIEPGFSAATLFARVSLDDRYADTAKRMRFFDEVLGRVASSSAGTVGAIDALPLSHSERLNTFEVEGVANRLPEWGSC